MATSQSSFALFSLMVTQIIGASALLPLTLHFVRAMLDENLPSTTPQRNIKPLLVLVLAGTFYVCEHTLAFVRCIFQVIRPESKSNPLVPDPFQNGYFFLLSLADTALLAGLHYQLYQRVYLGGLARSSYSTISARWNLKFTITWVLVCFAAGSAFLRWGTANDWFDAMTEIDSNEERYRIRAPKLDEYDLLIPVVQGILSFDIGFSSLVFWRKVSLRLRTDSVISNIMFMVTPITLCYYFWRMLFSQRLVTFSSSDLSNFIGALGHVLFQVAILSAIIMALTPDHLPWPLSHIRALWKKEHHIEREDGLDELLHEEPMHPPPPLQTSPHTESAQRPLHTRTPSPPPAYERDFQRSTIQNDGDGIMSIEANPAPAT